MWDGEEEEEAGEEEAEEVGEDDELEDGFEEAAPPGMIVALLKMARWILTVWPCEAWGLVSQAWSINLMTIRL